MLIFVPETIINLNLSMTQRFLSAVIIAMAATMACSGGVADSLRYTDMRTLPLLGTLAPDASVAYSRFPDSLKGNIRDDMWALGINSAGMSVRFRSDSPRLAARWTSRNGFNMNHMTPTGIRGLDLYVMQDDSSWTTLSSARPAYHGRSNTSLLVTDMTPGVMREYMLYLSLYDGVDSLYIGTDSASAVLPPAVGLPQRHKPVVMYGTSILQGGCATRPGMAHTNILQRMLQREVVNLGLSGNARLDPEIAQLMAQADASVYVIDALPNCKAAQIDSLMAPFVGIIRAGRPTTPIVLVESPVFPIARFNNEVSATLADKNARLRKAYDGMVAAGDSNLYYFEAADILGGDNEATVDNYHFTDTGFDIFARAMYPLLKSLIEN